MPYFPTRQPGMQGLALRPAPTAAPSTPAAMDPGAASRETNNTTEAEPMELGLVAIERRDTGAEERARRLQAKNRRKRYLELHPEYLTDPSLEFADPLLYDRTIRRFQTAAEREAAGLRPGNSGVMSAVLRVEAKKDALERPNPNSLFSYSRGPRGEILEEDKDEMPLSKEEGKAWWIDEMTQRFLRGEDDDFDYKSIDSSYLYDDPEEERDIQEAYFDSMDSDFDTDGEGKEKVLTGETGIQDY